MANRLDATRQSLPQGSRRLWRVLAVLISVPLLYILWVGKVELSIHGTVVEQGNGKPVPNAKVLVAWYGMLTPKLSFGESSYPTCYRAEVVTTDRNGRFRVPAWWAVAPLGLIERVSSYNMEVGVYHRGYQGWREEVETLPAQIVVQPFSGSPDERLADLGQLSHVARCNNFPEQAEFIQPLLNEVERFHVNASDIRSSTRLLLRSWLAELLGTQVEKLERPPDADQIEMDKPIPVAVPVPAVGSDTSPLEAVFPESSQQPGRKKP